MNSIQRLTRMTPSHTKLKIALFALVAVVASFVGIDRARAKPATQFQILTGFSAKEACSCAFVVEQTDAYCQAFGQIGGYDVDVSIDRGASAVTSTFLGTARTARFTAGDGCKLDPLP